MLYVVSPILFVAFLHDDAYAVLFVPIINWNNVCVNVQIFAATYEFVFVKDWWGINSVSLCWVQMPRQGMDIIHVIYVVNHSIDIQIVSEKKINSYTNTVAF